MKIKLQFTNNEKEAVIKELTKVDPNSNWEKEFNTPISETEDVIDYSYDGEREIWVDVPDRITVLVIEFIGKFGKMFTCFVEAFSDLWDKISEEKLNLSKERNEEVDEDWEDK